VKISEVFVTNELKAEKTGSSSREEAGIYCDSSLVASRDLKSFSSPQLIPLNLQIIENPQPSQPPRKPLQIRSAHLKSPSSGSEPADTLTTRSAAIDDWQLSRYLINNSLI
jgi:hypothetical protein